MIFRSRAIFVLATLFGFTLGVSRLGDLRLWPLPASADGQEATKAPVPPTSTDTSTEAVYLIAFDNEGRPITDLKPEEVRIFQDKMEQKITSVISAMNEPLTIGLFFDVSGSRRADQSVSDEARLASEFLHAIWHEGDTGFVLAFNNQMHPAAQPSHKLEDIDEGLAKIPQAAYSGSTALYDALCIVKPEKLNEFPGRKIYVALSDFEDNSSRIRLENVIAVAHAAKIAIFPVVLREGFESTYSKKADSRSRQTAKKIADQTGGEVLIPESPRELRSAFERLKSDVQVTYRITYLPLSLSGDRRKKTLHIELTRPHVKMLFAKD